MTLTDEQVRALQAAKLTDESGKLTTEYVRFIVDENDPYEPTCVALATEVLAQRERTCGTCERWGEYVSERCGRTGIKEAETFGCADWRAKETP